MRMKGIFLFPLFMIAAFYQSAQGDTVRVAQIDNSSLLINQRIGVYVSVTGEGGVPVTGLDSDVFTLYETSEGLRIERPVIDMREGVNVVQGVNFLLVIDNSGSMYWDAAGRIKNSDDSEIWRITAAKRAVEDLLKEIRNPKDRVGLVSFNMRIDNEVKPTDDKVSIERALMQITKPPEEEAYTELYETLYQSIQNLSVLGGRKVIIVLSDGVDFPKEDNPYFVERFGIEGVIERANKDGISIFTIGLSAKADNRSLSRIAQETGGAHFSTYSPQEISKLYTLIRDQILNEYFLVYRAAMNPAEMKLVSVEYSPGSGGSSLQSERFYFSETVFGFPRTRFPLLGLIPIPVAAILLWLLTLLKFERGRATPSLDVYQGQGRGRKVQTLAISPKKRTITIGADGGDDLTITGDRKVRRTMVQIEQREGAYRVTSSGSTMSVNNRAVRTKVLKSGDVIKVGDTTVVFDEGAKKNKN
jgi:Ca-activated chloride channel family protein